MKTWLSSPRADRVAGAQLAVDVALVEDGAVLEGELEEIHPVQRALRGDQRTPPVGRGRQHPAHQLAVGVVVRGVRIGVGIHGEVRRVAGDERALLQQPRHVRRQPRPVRQRLAPLGAVDEVMPGLVVDAPQQRLAAGGLRRVVDPARPEVHLMAHPGAERADLAGHRLLPGGDVVADHGAGDRRQVAGIQRASRARLEQPIPDARDELAEAGVADVRHIRRTRPSGAQQVVEREQAEGEHLGGGGADPAAARPCVGAGRPEQSPHGQIAGGCHRVYPCCSGG
jgi:hypothetical protein